MAEPAAAFRFENRFAFIVKKDLTFKKRLFKINPLEDKYGIY